MDGITRIMSAGGTSSLPPRNFNRMTSAFGNAKITTIKSRRPPTPSLNFHRGNVGPDGLTILWR